MWDSTPLAAGKRCSRCRTTKSLDAFGRWRNARDGHDTQCRECRHLREPKVGPTASGFILSRAIQGIISYDDYMLMLLAQDGTCAICRKRNGRRRLVVDHDHKTGIVRGLLCTRCNAALGTLGDDVESIDRVRAYLLDDL